MYIPLLVGVGVMVIAFLFSLALFYMDMESDRREKRHHETQLLSHKQPSIKPPMNKVRKAMEGSSISRHSRSSKSGEVKVEETEGNLLDAANEAEPGGGGHEHISLKDIAKLPASFWLLIVVCMLSEALFIPFLDNGNIYFSTIYSIDSTEAGTYLVLPYVFCALLCPFLGLLVDRLKWRSLVIIFSCLMFVITYGGMMFLEYQNDVPQALIAVPLILLGKFTPYSRHLLRTVLYCHRTFRPHGGQSQALWNCLRVDGNAPESRSGLLPSASLSHSAHNPRPKRRLQETDNVLFRDKCGLLDLRRGAGHYRSGTVF